MKGTKSQIAAAPRRGNVPKSGRSSGTSPLPNKRRPLQLERAMETPYPPIEKTGRFRLRPNLPDYETERAGFSWDAAESHLAGLPGGKWNIAHEAVDRHADGESGQRVAIRWLGRNGDVEDYTYAELAEATSRFASGLRRLGVGKGDRVFTLSSRIPELYIATLGALKNGSVAAPLFSAFGPEPIYQRMSRGRALQSDYMHWAKTRQQASFTLAITEVTERAELPMLTLADLGVKVQVPSFMEEIVATVSHDRWHETVASTNMVRATPASRAGSAQAAYRAIAPAGGGRSCLSSRSPTSCRPRGSATPRR